MDFIKADEFLKQNEKVQKVFIDWWVPSIGDLFAWNDDEDYHDMHEVNCCSSQNMVDMTAKNKGLKTGDRIPLLTEGALRKFIEDKTNASFEINFSEDVEPGEYKRCMSMYSNKNDLCVGAYQDLDCNLIKAYWQVAVEVASQC